MLKLLILLYLAIANAKYDATWKSLDTRPIPSWFDEAKVGIFLHWGLFSVPSITSEWFWSYWASQSSQEINTYMKNNFPPEFSYQEFARDFTAEFFNATQWAELFAKAGAKYVILTSKHHEGFTLWPSKYSYSWNAKDVGPHRDLVGELGEAVRTAGLKYGLYHSLYEWFNPLYIADRTSNFSTQVFSTQKAIPELVELVNQYQPSIIWSDGDWEAKDTYWTSTDFLAWLYNDSPVKDEVLVNDRWGDGIPCHHGDYFTCQDRYDPGKLQEKKWENAMTIDKQSWGFRRNAKLSDYLTPLELLTTLVRTISCGGNILINVGPSKEGLINPIFEERLTQLGEWLGINGEAIYESEPWTVQNDTLNSNVWYTSKDNAIYAIHLSWPENNTAILESVADLFQKDTTTVTLLGNSQKLKWMTSAGQVEIQMPDKAEVKSETAYVLKIVA
ncbi:alpha-L-fucosidase-like isoform X2 [Anthonomus grandis grandis]|uniref:alpha-L-fucosidase-like isoform X2 n=1 Tax=Anthonomus grandis grandis TaxID=2921223 RepID=UPI0021667A97|nr:alpha-L-fucosidase-like isoform X2 [Anthonomus grandis grandis]